jgi:hypothetical protein
VRLDISCELAICTTPLAADACAWRKRHRRDNGIRQRSWMGPIEWVNNWAKSLIGGIPLVSPTPHLSLLSVVRRQPLAVSGESLPQAVASEARTAQAGSPG